MKTRPVPLATVTKEAESRLVLRHLVCLCVFARDVELKHMEKQKEKYEGGGFFISDFEAGFSFEKWERHVLFCPRLFLDLLMKKKITQKRQREKFGGFSDMEIERLTIKALSVVDETPTSFFVSGLTGFAVFLSSECRARC